MKRTLLFLLTLVAWTPFNTFSQGYASVTSKVEGSKIIVDYSDTLDLINNKLKLRIGKDVTIIENIKSGYISKTKSVLYSRVKAVRCDFDSLTKIPILTSKDKRILLNKISHDSIIKNINVVVYDDYDDFTENRIDREFKGGKSNIDINDSQIESLLSSFIKNEVISNHSSKNTFGVAKNSARLNIDIIGMKLTKVEGILTFFELEIKYSLFDLNYNKIIEEVLMIESRHFTSQDFSDNLTHALKDGLCQFITHCQIDGSLQFETEDYQPFTDLKDIKVPINNHTNFVDARNAVVTIITEKGHGSGCLISDDGYILTNFHVISESDTIKAVTFKGDTLLGELAMTDPSMDIALVKTDTVSQNYFQLVENDLTLGETVYAIGTPIDLKLSQSISKGIISAHLEIDEIDYIQTDAEINGGNSGGALVDAKGQLIGLVNAKAVSIFIEGIGFAIDTKSIKERINISYK